MVHKIEESKLLKALADPKNTLQGILHLLVNEYSKPLYWKIRSFVLSHDDTDDILQNTFLKAWKNIERFEGKSKISTWLYSIAINESLNLLRSQKETINISTYNSISNSLFS